MSYMKTSSTSSWINYLKTGIVTLLWTTGILTVLVLVYLMIPVLLAVAIAAFVFMVYKMLDAEVTPPESVDSPAKSDQ